MVSADEDIRSILHQQHSSGSANPAAAAALSVAGRLPSAEPRVAADPQWRIPAIIHQTYKSAAVPPAVRPYMQVRLSFLQTAEECHCGAAQCCAAHFSCAPVVATHTAG